MNENNITHRGDNGSPKSMRDSLAIPIAIIIAAGLIAGAIYINGGTKVVKEPTIDDNLAAAVESTAENMRPVDSTDHIRGNPNAPILLVEYSDYDCPFCKQFHETMKQIVDEYGGDGKVAWVYRHLPIAQLHPNAPKIAEAAECAAELGGTEAFWNFSDIVFDAKPANDMTNIAELPTYAEQAGLDRTRFVECLESGRYTDKIAASIADAANAGARGTPHTIVLVGDQTGVINGAQPYEVVKGIVEQVLAQIEGKAPEAE